MTARNPTAAERAAHAKKVRASREAARDLQKCRDCNVRPEINPLTGLPFASCKAHRDADCARKKKAR